MRIFKFLRMTILLWLTLMEVASFGQSKKWTQEQIEAVDKIIVSISDKNEDRIFAIKSAASILNISEQDASDYIERRAIQIVSSHATKMQTAKTQIEKIISITQNNCINHIKKLHAGELLTYEEIEDFGRLYKFEDFLYGERIFGIFLKASKIPVMRNKQIIFGDGSGNGDEKNSEYWNSVITLQGTIVTDDNLSIIQLTTFHEGAPCIILWTRRGEKTFAIKVYKIDHDRIRYYHLHERGNVNAWATSDLEGFTNEGIAKWQQDSVYIVENLQTIVDDNVNRVNSYRRQHYTKLPEFDIKSAMSKKAKPLPDNYKNVLNNLRYIENQGDYEVWAISDGNDLKEVKSLINALQSEKNMVAYFNNSDDEYINSIIRKLILSKQYYKYYYTLQDYYKEQLPRALLNNQYYIKSLYIKYTDGKIHYPLFLINRKNSQVFLVESTSAWNNKPKIIKINTQSK